MSGGSKPYLTADKEGMTAACPECDEAGKIYRRQGPRALDDPDAEYRCGDCGATFDQWNTRESRRGNGGPAKYGDLSPEDLDL